MERLKKSARGSLVRNRQPCGTGGVHRRPRKVWRGAGQSRPGRRHLVLRWALQPEPGPSSDLWKMSKTRRGKAINHPPRTRFCRDQAGKTSQPRRPRFFFLSLNNSTAVAPAERTSGSAEKSKQFYESPGLIGCAMAISRTLYEELWDSIRIWRPGC